MKTVINFPVKYNSEEFFAIERGQIVMTGHDHYGSPYESCNSCGNCSGARCDFCHKTTTNSRFSLSLDSEEMVTALVENGVDIDVAKDISYIGFHLDYSVNYPTPSKDWFEIDQDVRNTINFMIKAWNPKTFGELADYVLSIYGCTGHTRYRGHIHNQLELYWIECNFNHDKACGRV